MRAEPKVKKKLEPLGAPLVKLALVIVLGGVAPLLDTTIVNIALHTLVTEFHAGIDAVQWVTTGYLLALAVTIPVTTWATDRIGTRWLWLIGLTAFVIGSAASGLSWSLGSLIGFRVLQGVGAGIIQPVLSTILVRAAGPAKLGRVLTIVTLVAVIAPIAGPLVGGAIVANASWRWIFFVNVPLCVAGIVLAWIVVPPDTARRPRHLDRVGLALLAPGLLGIVYGLTMSSTDGGFGSLQAVLPLVTGVALLAAFVIWGLRKRVEPLLDLSLFRVRSFTAASGVMFFSGLSLYGPMLLLPLFYQEVRGASAFLAGLVLALQGAGSLSVRWVGGFIDRVGARPFAVAGILVAALGTVPFAFAGADSNAVLLAAALIIRGAGLSTANIAVMAGAYRDVPRTQVADASAFTRVLQQLGGSLGTAVLAAVLAATAVVGAPAAGFRVSFTWAIALTVVALVPALFLSGTTGGGRTSPGGARP